jgi:alpha-glucan,water dikinase
MVFMKRNVGIVSVLSREISAAQDNLTNLLREMYTEQPENREMIRLIMGTVGRGGQGDVGQRIRDEILVIQVCCFGSRKL